MSENGVYDLIIIGAGPGGLSAGVYAMRAALKTVLIEMAAPGGQVNNSDSVENWPGDEHISGAELAFHSLHEHAWVSGEIAHTDAVTQDGAAGEWAGGIHCDYANRLVGGTVGFGQFVDQSALTSAGCPRHADDMRPAGVRIDLRQAGVGVSRLVFDVGDQPRDGPTIA